MTYNIGIIGAGNMGGAIYKNLIKNQRTPVFVYDTDINKVKSIQKKFLELDKIIKNSQIIILAIKPQSLYELADQLKGAASGKLIISIMAGVKMQKISQLLQVNKIIRAMPNLPIKTGDGMTAWVANKYISKQEKDEARKLFSFFGTELEFKQEDKLDAVTAISGSGPAYFFYFSELLERAAVKLGLTKQEAKILVEKTFIGSEKLFTETESNFKELKGLITSAKGTTAAALDIFKKNNFEEIVTAAVKSAHSRARELASSGMLPNK